jgi:two-component system chemotaxis response regulator CheB
MESRQLLNATCPECRGPLTEIRRNGIVEYQCLVGHLYSAPTLLDAHSETEEKSLWEAVVALEEAENLAQSASTILEPAIAERVLTIAKQKRRLAEEIRSILRRLEPFPVD